MNRYTIHDRQVHADTPEKCPESGRTAAWCTDQSHKTCGVGIAAGIVVDRYQDV